MFYKINSNQTGKILDKTKDTCRIIIVYHWNNCSHCRTFIPILYDLLQKKPELLKTAKIFEVEYNDFKYLPEELTNISAFPSVVAIENGKKVGEFSEQRTPENLTEFIKSNSSKSQSHNTRKKMLRQYSSKKN